MFEEECEFCGGIFLDDGTNRFCSNDCQMNYSKIKTKLNTPKPIVNKLFLDIDIYASENGTLVGEDLGIYIHDNFIKNKLDLTKKNLIIFPCSINRVSLSFIKGLTDDLVETLGTSTMREHIEFRGSSRVVKKINYDLYNVVCL